MSPRARTATVVGAGGVLLLLMLWGFGGLPGYGRYPGPYGDVLNAVGPRERKIPNIVTAVNFDYRGLDTLGEEYILFVAVAGLALVLRKDRRRITDDPLPSRQPLREPPRTDAIAAFSCAAIALTGAFGIYLGIHAAQTPGGGFQGGAIASGFTALVFLGLGYRTFERFVPQERIESFEAAGAAGYAVIGLVGLVTSGAFLTNVLPLGGEGQLFSAGTITVINLCVLLEVLAGFALTFLEFARETRVEAAEPPAE